MTQLLDLTVTSGRTMVLMHLDGKGAVRLSPEQAETLASALQREARKIASRPKAADDEQELSVKPIPGPYLSPHWPGKGTRPDHWLGFAPEPETDEPAASQDTVHTGTAP